MYTSQCIYPLAANISKKSSLSAGRLCPAADAFILSAGLSPEPQRSALLRRARDGGEADRNLSGAGGGGGALRSP